MKFVVFSIGALLTAATLRADFNHSFGAPASVPCGDQYTVGGDCEETENGSYVEMWIYKDGAEIAHSDGWGSTSASATSDGSASYSAHFTSGNGDDAWDYADTTCSGGGGPPSVSITASASSVTTGQTVNIYINAQDPGGQVQYINMDRMSQGGGFYGTSNYVDADNPDYGSFGVGGNSGNVTRTITVVFNTEGTYVFRGATWASNSGWYYSPTNVTINVTSGGGQGAGGSSGGGATFTPDANTLLLLHGDGSNNSTSITDSSPSNREMTARGNVHLSTSQTTAGSASLWFNGGDPDALTFLNSPLYINGPFTFECWFRSSNINITQHFYNSTWMSGGYNSQFRIETNSMFFFYINGAAINATVPTMSSNTWYHIALVRDQNSVIKVYLNGVASNETVTSGNTVRIDNIGSWFMDISGYGSQTPFYGYIDELRISNVARYTGNFTPPTGSGGSPPTMVVVGGNNQATPINQFNAQPFDVAVWNAAGTQPLVGQAITFTVQSGGGFLATTNTGSPSLLTTLNLTTDVDGTAKAYYKQPGTAGVTSQVLASSGGAQLTLTTQSSAGDTTPPTAPPGIVTSATSPTMVVFAWTAATDPGTGASGVAGYNVYRNGTQLNTSLVTSTSYIDSTAAAGSSYTYTVKAVDAAGNLSSATTLSVSTPSSSSSGSFEVFTPTQ